ncbi:MAG: DUF4388 domain-containing protein [Candidatus Aminicenantes bacterium]|nr:DUF4388 domain-containing protein [Candidatus Aminicenantes bacterium]
MAENPLQGDLSLTSFPRLLFHIWKRKKTGCLHLKTADGENGFVFKNGLIIVEKKGFPEDDFFKALVEKKILGPLDFENCLRYSGQKNTSLMRAFLEIHETSAAHLWEQMKEYLYNELFPFFNCSQAAFDFDAGHHFYDSDIYFQIPTQELILDGVRSMKNLELIKTMLPPLNTPVRAVQPSWSTELALSPADIYILNLLSENTTLAKVLKASNISQRESLTSIYTLYSLGFLIFSQKSSHDSFLDEYLPLDFEQIVSVFNTNCTHIYKYISKEIGPVSINVLKKCLEEIKPSLTPIFQKIELGTDGSVSLNANLRAKFTLFSLEEKRSFIENLNEILVAEVLAVKKVFGSEHESKIMKNLTIWKE